MQILIPMSGAGSRFTAAGYSTPKPFIEFHGKTMIENVVENLGYQNSYALVVQRNHYETFEHVFENIKKKVRKLDIFCVDGVTRGAAESCLLAEKAFNFNDPIMIANCDQMMHWRMFDFTHWFFAKDLDGAIMTFDSQNPKNSYAAVDDNGIVTRTVEKEVISEHATNGICVWRHAADFFYAARYMINQNITTNGEFYVCPIYNINIEWKQKIGIYKLAEGCHWPIGTPEDLDIYLARHKHKELNENL